MAAFQMFVELLRDIEAKSISERSYFLTLDSRGLVERDKDLRKHILRSMYFNMARNIKLLCLAHGVE